MNFSESVDMFTELVGSMLLLYAIALPFEVIFPIQRHQRWGERGRNLVYMVCFLLITILFIAPVFNLISSIIILRSGGGFLPVFTDSDSPWFSHLLFGGLFALIWDVWQYAVHRLQHSISFLWKTHRFHHSETFLNATSQSRTHITQYVLYLVLYLPIVVFLSGQSPHIVIAFIMFRILGIYNHSNIRVDLGYLTPVISGPQWHRIHHSIERRHQDKNFAAIFPVIDIIFGTYYRPKKDEFPETGLCDEKPARFIIDATILPFDEWYKSIKSLIISRR